MNHNDAIYRMYLLGLLRNGELFVKLATDKNTSLSELIALLLGVMTPPFAQTVCTRQEILSRVENILD